MFKVGDYVRSIDGQRNYVIVKGGQLLVDARNLASGNVLTFHPEWVEPIPPHEVALIKLREAASAGKD